MAYQFEKHALGRRNHYHPPIVGADDEWQGKTWRDMPGNHEALKRMNFALFRRGLHSGEISNRNLERLQERAFLAREARLNQLAD